MSFGEQTKTDAPTLEDPDHPRAVYLPTNNRMGWIISGASDPFLEAFIEYASLGTVDGSRRVLELGAGFGEISARCAEAGASCVVNDLEQAHLEPLRNLPADVASRLTCLVARFPNETTFAKASFDAILAARVLHFLDGAEIDHGLREMFRWLKPNGKCFVTAETPFRANLRPFLPIYETRVATGERWPGWIEDTTLYFPFFCNLPNRMNFLDVPTLERAFREAGFIVEQCATYERRDAPPEAKLDGREGVGLIASKP